MDDIVFIGDWIKDRVLGSGSFGVVVLWKHKRTDEKLAIKTCKWGNELTQKHRERWTKEVEMLQSCKNPNIVGTKELPPEFVMGLERANPSRLPILCMEFCSGGDLRQLLNKPDSCAGLKEVQVRQILKDVGNAMRFLHYNKITHRDLKPENIVLHVIEGLGDIGGQKQFRVTYKLIDLGYAKEIDSNSICASFVGTLQYLAPEILYSKSYSNSVDFWSLGLLAFEIICGTRPFLPFMAPVQWMPHVKKKAHDNICVFETFHGDIEYSDEIFPENHVSKPFQALIEKWLRVALEWDPKLRGRDNQTNRVTFDLPSEEKESSSNIVIFDLLDNILSKTIIKVFSVSTLSHHAYELEKEITISTLKKWLQKETGVLFEEQLLISPTSYSEIRNTEFAINFYNDQQQVMLYLYDKTNIIKNNIKPIVPKSVQRCLENPRALYNFKNSQYLYRCALYFVISQSYIYECLVNGLLVRAESLKYESKQMLLGHNTVDKNIGNLVTKEKTITIMTDTGKKHIENLRKNGTGANFLGGFDKILKASDEITDKIHKLQSAWTQLSVRLQSATRRSNEVLSVDLNNFISKYNYQSIFTDAITAYMSYRKSDFFNENRSKEKPCTDIVKVCYECLKLRSQILQELNQQPFILKLTDLNTEFPKIADIITKAEDNREKLLSELSTVADDLTDCMWSTISMLSCEASTLADVPYSVISFQKRDFKIGAPVSNHCINVKNKIEDDGKLKSLIKESFQLRKLQNNLSKKILKDKKLLTENCLDFSFLDEN